MVHTVVAYGGIAWLAVLLAACALFVARGRTSLQRVLALDLLVTVFVGLLALAAAEDGLSYALDVALALALLSFLSTLTASRYLVTRRPFGEHE